MPQNSLRWSSVPFSDLIPHNVRARCDCTLQSLASPHCFAVVTAVSLSHRIVSWVPPVPRTRLTLAIHLSNRRVAVRHPSGSVDVVFSATGSRLRKAYVFLSRAGPTWSGTWLRAVAPTATQLRVAQRLRSVAWIRLWFALFVTCAWLLLIFDCIGGTMDLLGVGSLDVADNHPTGPAFDQHAMLAAAAAPILVAAVGRWWGLHVVHVPGSRWWLAVCSAILPGVGEASWLRLGASCIAHPQPCLSYRGVLCCVVRRCLLPRERVYIPASPLSRLRAWMPLPCNEYSGSRRVRLDGIPRASVRCYRPCS